MFHKPKILFVQPSQKTNNISLWKSRTPWLPRLAIPQLIAMTPEEYETEILDEYLDEINFDTDADLIAISALTLEAPRAYEISNEFRRRGKKTIIGGIHASLIPDEAQNYADSIYVGEGEVLWKEILNDLKNNNLKSRYQTLPGKFDITEIPSPDFSKLNLKRYRIPLMPIQTTRGCPHNCDFCSVTRFHGRAYRHRSIENVVQEIKQLGRKKVFFVDDNISASHDRAKKLFEAITPLKISWLSQSCISMADNDELLEKASKSGCTMLFLGLESISDQNLKSIGKSINNVQKYAYAIEKFHKYGIKVIGSIIFGFDNDDETVFERTANIVEDLNIDFPCYWILTPFPNTPLYEKLKEEGRITNTNWAQYDGSHVVFEPKLMSSEVLLEGYQYAFKRAYSLPNITKRLCYTLKSSRIARNLIIRGGLYSDLGFSYLFKRGVMQGFHPMMG